MFITITLITLICIGMIYVVSYFWRRLSFIQTINILPGPKAFPLIGNIPYILGVNINIGNNKL